MKYNTRLLSWVLLLSSNFAVLGQQHPQFSLATKLYNFSNPGYSGVENKKKAAFLHRTQWLGYEPTDDRFGRGRPITQLASFELPISLIPNTNSDDKLEGLGLILLNDNIGIYNQTAFKVSLSKRVQINKTTKLGIGIRPGVLSQSIKHGDLLAVDQGDPVVQELASSQNIRISPTLDLGVWLSNEKTSGGLSVHNVLRSVENTSIFFIQRVVEANVITSIPFKQFIVKPQLTILSDFRNLNYNFGVSSQVSIINRIDLEFGLSLRQSVSSVNENVSWSNNDVIASIGLPRLPKVPLGLFYAVDVVSQGISAKSNTSHEIMLTYILERNHKVHINKRYTPRYKYND